MVTDMPLQNPLLTTGWLRWGGRLMSNGRYGPNVQAPQKEDLDSQAKVCQMEAQWRNGGSQMCESMSRDAGEGVVVLVSSCRIIINNLCGTISVHSAFQRTGQVFSEELTIEDARYLAIPC